MHHWVYGGASVIGTSHVSTSQACEDYSLSRPIPLHRGEILVLACADGAGSAAYALEGARMACETVYEAVEAFAAGDSSESDLSPDHLLSWIGQARARITRQADERAAIPRDFASTLLVGLLTANRGIFGHIGDGAIIVGEGFGDDLTTVSWPVQGEFANSTFFLTDDDWSDHARILECPDPVNKVAIFTDGIQRLALHYETQSVHRPFFEPMFQHILASPTLSTERLSSLVAGVLSSDTVNRRTDDDKTLLIAARPV
jgi:hypothetical protein